MSLQFKNPNHHVYISNKYGQLEKALEACTRLGVGAHQDDLEVMAGHGIVECFRNPQENFFGVTCTDGAGSARSGAYKNYTDAQMQDVRKQEQVLSAQLGEYAGVIQLGYSSASLKTAFNLQLVNELKAIIESARPQVIYTHNPADKHQTHVAVTAHLVRALRESQHRPQSFYGCEVWRSLDWLPDNRKIALPISKPQLIEKLIACHQSQTVGGKRYDIASLGRMKANATFFESHHVDEQQNLWFALDLMPLLENSELSIYEFIQSPIEEMRAEVQGFLDNFSGS